MEKKELKKLRNRCRKTQMEVAEVLNVSLATFKRWEEYETFPDCISYLKLCEIYECEIDDVYFPDRIDEKNHCNTVA